MPIYEYRCESCGHLHDALQKISDPHLTDCPACAASALKRLMSAPSFRLKGSGWYETDFKSDKENKRNLVDSASDSGSTGDGGKSEGGSKDQGAKESKAKSEASASGGGDSGAKKPEASKKPKGGSGTEAA